MLRALRVTLASYTASFRVPHFVGHQLTLPVPPLSTIYGLISAAAGRWVTPEEVEWLAYRCEYCCKARDLETIYQFERKETAAAPRPKPPPETTNVLPREFLYLPRLTLYLPPRWEEAFARPRFSLLLGRTQDVAAVEELKVVELQFVSGGKVGGVILPFSLLAKGRVSAWLQSLPVAFTEDPGRRPVRVQIFGVVDAKRPGEIEGAKGWLVKDPETGFVVPLYRREWVMYGGEGASGEVG